MSVYLQEDFFIVLHNILAEMEEVAQLQPVPDAHVPVMKFKFQGISIDLLYASISLSVVPEVSFFFIVSLTASILFRFLWIDMVYAVNVQTHVNSMWLSSFFFFFFFKNP